MPVPPEFPPGACDRRVLWHFLARWWNPGRCYRVLDWSGGSGVLPRVMVEFARAREITLRIDAMGLARRMDGYPEIIPVADERAAMPGGGGYDLVHGGLVLHRCGLDEAGRLLRWAREQSGRWTLVTDLVRQPGAALSAWALAWALDRAALPAAQARAAVGGAWSFRQLGALAREAGWQGFGHARYLGARQALWLDGRGAAEMALDPFEVPSPA